jgi:DNA-directed RNA polymerase subunit alpha
MTLRIHIPKEVKVISHGDTHAEVLLEGLYPGYGITVGNALRRVLLSSLPGAAITSFRIAGVPHEFTTIPGVVEDVVEIMLNLKRIRLKSFSEEPVELTLKVKGEREVKAGDIEKNPMVEIVNPEAHIATITEKNVSLEMMFRVERGIGYLPVELRKKEKLPIGEIALDAIFTPITKVNFQVENMRVGDRTDYNRLRLSVDTDGTTDPIAAIKEASEILMEHFALFSSLGGAPEPSLTTSAGKQMRKSRKKKVKDETSS